MFKIFASKPKSEFIGEKIFDDLTPKLYEPADDDVYMNSLNWALHNDNIRNVAVTGPYGSGKSSILRTFAYRHKHNFKFLNISLASFDEKIEQLPGNNPDQDKNLNQRIEISILQQIFYNEKHRDLPYSRFSRIRNLTGKSLFFQTILLALWLLVTVQLFFPMWLLPIRRIIYTPPISNSVWWTVSHWLAFIYFGAGVCYGIKSLISLAFDLNVKKINVKEGKIDLSRTDLSILNKYLDEILYFFEVRKYDVVIIEDIDRFREPEIFTKLRELNLLINNAQQINRKVVFIYALKDDMFKDKSRAKFFDFIVPVIPVINSSNAKQPFINNLPLLNKGIDPNLQLTKQFIGSISIFIDDMRMLKNICNEFCIYKGKLNDLKLDCNKLMAMIVYKNFYPEDFASLHLEKGLVYDVFKNKHFLINGIIKEINEKISLIEKDLINLDKTVVEDLIELREIYLQRFMVLVPDASAIIINGVNVTFRDMKLEKNFEVFASGSSILYLSRPYARHTNSGKSISDLETTSDPERKYQNRVKLLRDGKVTSQQRLKSELELLINRKWKIQTDSFKDLLLNDDIQITEHYAEIADKKMLFYILREGFIDENYSDYISFFYPGELTKNDKLFLRANKYREPLPYDFKLTNVANIIDDLSAEELIRTSVLNNDLLDFVSDDTTKYKESLSLMIAFLGKTKNFDFIDQYIINGLQTNMFFKQLCHAWPELWVDMVTSVIMPDMIKKLYFEKLMSALNIEELQLINVDNFLAEYISNQQNYFELTDKNVDSEKLNLVVKVMNIKFKILPMTKEKIINNFVYQGNYYALNVQNLENLINHGKKKHPISYDFNRENYSVVLSSELKEMQTYVEDNIDTYVQSVFLELSENKFDNEAIILRLLNTNNVRLENRQTIIERMQTIITELSSVQNKYLWRATVEYGKMAANWANLLTYYDLNTLPPEEELESGSAVNGDERIEVMGLDTPFISFMNADENYRLLAGTKVGADSEKNDEELLAFERDLILTNGLSTDAYIALISSINFAFDDLNCAGLDEEKVKALIEYKILTLTTTNVTNIEASYPALKVKLLATNMATYLQAIADYTLDDEDHLQLLMSREASNPEKIKFIENSPVDSIIQNQFIASEAAKILTTGKHSELSMELLKGLLANSEYIRHKVILLTEKIGSLEHSEIADLLKSLGEPYEDLAERGKHASIQNTAFNRALGAKLSENGYVSSMKMADDAIRFTWV